MTFLPMLLGPGDFDPPPDDVTDYCHICQSECNIDDMKYDKELFSHLCADCSERLEEEREFELNEGD